MTLVPRTVKVRVLAATVEESWKRPGEPITAEPVQVPVCPIWIPLVA
jgi:hypothetical protein